MFAQHGARLFLSDINQAALTTAIDRVKELAPDAAANILGKVCDVSKESQVAELVEAADKQWPEGIDIIFNNAGIMHPADDDALTTDEKVWDLTHNISIRSYQLYWRYADSR